MSEIIYPAFGTVSSVYSFNHLHTIARTRPDCKRQNYCTVPLPLHTLHTGVTEWKEVRGKRQDYIAILLYRSMQYTLIAHRRSNNVDATMRKI